MRREAEGLAPDGNRDEEDPDDVEVVPSDQSPASGETAYGLNGWLVGAEGAESISALCQIKL